MLKPLLNINHTEKEKNKIMASDIPQSIHGKDLPKSGLSSTITVNCEHIEKMLHTGTQGKFAFSSDEPAKMGGDDNHPAPLTYIAAGIGF